MPFLRHAAVHAGCWVACSVVAPPFGVGRAEAWPGPSLVLRGGQERSPRGAFGPRALVAPGARQKPERSQRTVFVIKNGPCCSCRCVELRSAPALAERENKQLPVPARRVLQAGWTHIETLRRLLGAHRCGQTRICGRFSVLLLMEMGRVSGGPLGRVLHDPGLPPAAWAAASALLGLVHSLPGLAPAVIRRASGLCPSRGQPAAFLGRPPSGRTCSASLVSCLAPPRPVCPAEGPRGKT